MTKLKVNEKGKNEQKNSSEDVINVPMTETKGTEPVRPASPVSYQKVLALLIFLVTIGVLVQCTKLYGGTILRRHMNVLLTPEHLRSGHISLDEDCKVMLVETIPIGLDYPDSNIVHVNTTEVWLYLIKSAQKSIEIASMYWTMKREDVYPDDSAIEGEMVFEALKSAGRDRNISLRIVQSPPSELNPNKNTEELARDAKAEVRVVDFDKLLGAGILHTKLWIIDGQRVYVGSANMDWRALTQVKELGIFTTRCPSIGRDLQKIFQVYWFLGQESIPQNWPQSLSTIYNYKNPMKLSFDGSSYKSYFASSPPRLSPEGRENDIDAILNCIHEAKEFIHIAVMDYFPLMLYDKYHEFWPVIDDALKKAAIERKVKVKLLVSWWTHSRKSESYFLDSLMAISNDYEGYSIQVKRFIVPHTPEQNKIPYCRVNHNKYMVTDESAYIGTSNWSGDYFTTTAGIGMVFKSDPTNPESNLRQQLQDIFDRDWNSIYAHPANTTR